MSIAINNSTFPNTSTISNNASLICCNGGIPLFVDENSLNIFDGQKNFKFDERDDDCILFSLKNGIIDFSKFEKGDISISCQCPEGYFGDSCQLYQDSVQSNISITNHTAYSLPFTAAGDNSSFKIFIFIAIVPLSFALFAAIGGFLCRMCFCDCFAIHDYCKRCWSKDPYNLENGDDDVGLDLDDAEAQRQSAFSNRYREDQRRSNEPTSSTAALVQPNLVTNGRVIIDQPASTPTLRFMEPPSLPLPSSAPKPEDDQEGGQRKYSPPPPYSSIVIPNNKDATTQTNVTA